MATTPQSGGSWEPDKDRSSPGPADDSNDKPEHSAIEHEFDKSEQGLEEREQEREEELEERERLRDRGRFPANYIGDPDDSPSDPAEIEKRILVLNGSLFLAVRRKWAHDPLRDPEAKLGVCDFHALPNTVAIEDNPCAFQCVSYLVSPSPTDLRQALWLEGLIGSPDLPPAKLWKSIDEEWCIVELKIEAVRCGWLLDDPALSGGEPQLRHDGQQLASRDASSWRRTREMLGQDAAMVILGGDPEGPGLAERIVIFSVPGVSLTEVNALQWGEPTSFSELDGWRDLGGGHPRMATMPNRQSLARRTFSRLKFRYRMWRENRRAAAKERRERRQERQERRDQRRQASAERWAVRVRIFEGLREALAVIREAAETAIVVAKAATFFLFIFGGPPVTIVIVIKLIGHIS